MDKQMFLNILEKKLSEHQISKEDIEKHISDMEKFLNTVSDEEFAKEDPSEEEIAEIALNVVQRSRRESAEKKAELQIAREPSVSEAEAAVETEDVLFEETKITQELAEEAEPLAESADEADEETVLENISEEEQADETEEADDVLELLAKEAQEERKDKETYEELKRLAIERAIAEQDEIIVNHVEENDPIEAIVDPAERPDIAFDETEAIKNAEKEDVQFEAPLKKEEAQAEKSVSEEETPYTISDADDFYVEEDDIVPVEDNGEEYELKPVKRKKKREKVKGTPLFWILFILTLPISVPILLAIATLFGVAYASVTAIIVVFSAAMIACVAAGTALALIGIIYGIIECTNVPVLGAFEIGLGVAIGGATILISVLLYNIAIRFTPMLYKCITRFAKFVMEKIADLYYTIKKECGK